MWTKKKSTRAVHLVYYGRWRQVKANDSAHRMNKKKIKKKIQKNNDKRNGARARPCKRGKPSKKKKPDNDVTSLMMMISALGSCGRPRVCCE